MVKLEPLRALLIAGHPGHELRLFDWMCELRPDVVVLTNGAGSGGRPRIESSRRALMAAGARATTLFGQHSDQDFYRALLAGDCAFFAAVESTLSAILAAGDYQLVVADPLEGYNPSHDLCRVLTNIAIERQVRLGRRPPVNCDYALTTPLPAGAGLEVRMLDETQLVRKLAAGRDYPELKREIDHALAREGQQAFTREQLRRLDGNRLALSPPELPPYYERYGEQRRDAGVYSEVIRHDLHVQPIVDALIAQLPPLPT